MMNRVLRTTLVLLSVAVIFGCEKQDQNDTRATGESVTEKETHQLPPNNPYLMQDSAYTHVHFDAAANDASRVAAWTGDMILTDANIDWLPWVTTIGTAHAGQYLLLAEAV